jgi:hypothetical protein
VANYDFRFFYGFCSCFYNAACTSIFCLESVKYAVALFVFGYFFYHYN